MALAGFSPTGCEVVVPSPSGRARGMTLPADECRPETLIATDAVQRALAIARRGIGAADITAKVGETW